MEAAWYQDLDPTGFLARSLRVYPDKTAVIYNDLRYSYRQLCERVNRLAGALKSLGVGRGDRVAFLLLNIPAMLDAHYGPMSIGAVLVAINYRLSAREITQVINHSGAKALVFDSEFAPVVREVRAGTDRDLAYVQVVDTAPKDEDIPGPDYEAFLASAPSGNHHAGLTSELDTIAINYTSGTTGMPKGVQYNARGVYLNALGEIIEMGLSSRSTYLWTLPMFHCNGWCYTWAVMAAGGTHVCLRRPDPVDIYRLVREERVTHMCGAPTVLISMYSSPAAEGQDLSGLTIATAGAPPSPQVIRTMEGMGASIHHLYGLTETYGPHTICAVQPGWQDLSTEDRARLKARQGVPYVIAGDYLRVVDGNMEDVPDDGVTIGEVVMRGNNVMSGYLDDAESTQDAFRGGWFHSGDLAVRHPDGYIELQDRAKDIIISGGENISSQEVEKVIMEHPGVLEVCVVAVPDERWGEVPKAFVTRKPGEEVAGEEIIEFCKERIARFKAPKYVEFGDLPKTATGKVQKYVLREAEWKGYEKSIH